MEVFGVGLTPEVDFLLWTCSAPLLLRCTLASLIHTSGIYVISLSFFLSFFVWGAPNKIPISSISGIISIWFCILHKESWYIYLIYMYTVLPTNAIGRNTPYGAAYRPENARNATDATMRAYHLFTLMLSVLWSTEILAFPTVGVPPMCSSLCGPNFPFVWSVDCTMCMIGARAFNTWNAT